MITHAIGITDTAYYMILSENGAANAAKCLESLKSFMNVRRGNRQHRVCLFTANAQYDQHSMMAA